MAIKMINLDDRNKTFLTYVEPCRGPLPWVLVDWFAAAAGATVGASDCFAVVVAATFASMLG